MGSEIEARLVLGDRFPIEVVIERDATSVRVSMQAPQGPASPELAPTFELALRLTGDPACRMNGEQAPWPLWRGLPVAHGRPLDPFAEALVWASRAMFARPPEAGVTDVDRRNASTFMRALYARLRELAIHAADACDPAARRTALRFPPHARWYVYRQIARDASGRVAQLASACPGALLFAAAHDEGHRSEPYAPALAGLMMARAVAGVRLDHLLAETVEIWFDAGRARGRASRSAEWRRLADADPGESDRIRSGMRLLLRRARQSVPASFVVLPPPLVLVPEDIPELPRANAAWFRATKGVQALRGPDPSVPAALRLRLLAFASRHAAELDALRARRDPTVTNVVQTILDHALATGHAPGRDAAPEPVVLAARRFRRSLERASRLARQITAGPGGGPLEAPGSTSALAGLDAIPLLPPPWPAWSCSELSAQPITTMGGLVRTGLELGNCLANNPFSFMRAPLRLYRVHVDGGLLAVALRSLGTRWRLDQCAGAANRRPTDREERAVEAWLSCANAGALEAFGLPNDEVAPKHVLDAGEDADGLPRRVLEQHGLAAPPDGDDIPF